MVLDNPIYHSLASRHRHLAIPCGEALRYPPEVAPFVGSPASEIPSDLQNFIAPGETIVMVGARGSLGGEWEVLNSFNVRQYLWPTTLPHGPQEGVVALSEEHIPLMLELTGIAYPAYFRLGTARLGDYFGVIEEGSLRSMAGVRMAMDGFQEISAIVTHPEHRGRGFAARLTKHVIHHITWQGDQPFLHTEAENEAAQALYQKLGFVVRTELPVLVATRLPS